MTKVKELHNAKVTKIIYLQLMNHTFHANYTKDLLSPSLMHNWASSDLEGKGLNCTPKTACLWEHVQIIWVPIPVHFNIKIKLNHSMQSPGMLWAPYRPKASFYRDKNGIYTYTEKKWLVSRSAHTYLIPESVCWP